LLDFLDQVIDSPRLHRTTVLAIRSAWRSVTKELGISHSNTVALMSPDDLVDAFVARRGPNFRSGATYRTRLRVGQQLYQAWLAEDPDWTDIARTRAVPAPQMINQSGAGQPAPLVVKFPLRSDLAINVEIPEQLTYPEVERIAAFLKSMVIPDGDPGQKEAPAT
jgi:hypothetical protein